MQVFESRRLTGPSLIWMHQGAVLDARFSDEEADALIPQWRSAVSGMLGRLGLGDESLMVRRYPDGASLAISAPLDALYAATEINDWAMNFAIAAVNGSEPAEDEQTAYQRLSLALAEERNPALIALTDAAISRGIPFLVDDDDFTLGLGTHGQTWPVSTLPDLNKLDWTAYAGVPVGLVTGTNGKTTSVRFLNSIARAAGHTAGVSSTDWIAVGDEIVNRDDWSGPGGARAVLRDRRVTLGLLETARGGLLRRGLGVSAADAALITNIAEDHLGEFGVMNVDELADVKWVVTSVLGRRGRAVLNAQDPRLVERSKNAECSITWFSLDPDLPLIKTAVAAGQRAVVLRGEELVLIRDGVESIITTVAAVPLTINGAAKHNVANALGAIGLADALGIDREHIASGLAATSDIDNPGRCNLFHIDGFDVLVDFAHNPAGMEAIIELAARMPARRRLILIGQAGDRSDSAIRELAARAWSVAADHVVIKEMPRYARGRAPNEVAGLIREALLEAGAKATQIDQFEDESEAVDFALQWAQPGDLLVLFIHAQIDAMIRRLRQRTAG